MKNLFFKSLIAIFLVITICSLTACGGGGSSSDPIPPTTANVKVTVPGKLFDNANLGSNARASVTVQSLKIRAIAYDNEKGNEVQGVQHINTVATYTLDDEYIAKVNGLSKTYDYRFIVLFGEEDKEKVLLQNHVNATDIK